MQNSRISISLWASICGVILYLLIILLLYSHGMRFSNQYPEAAFVSVFIIPLLAAGAVCGFYERTSWSGKVGAFVCSLLLTAAVIILVMAFMDVGSIMQMTLIAILPPAILIGFFAGLVARRIKAEKLKPNWSHLLVCWLLGPVWIGLCCILTLLGKAILYGPLETGKIAQAATGVLSLPFGPYTTLAAKLGQWPNAGEFFSLGAAVWITALILLSASGYMITKNQTMASVTVIVFATTANAAVIIGIGQLLNCTS